MAVYRAGRKTTWTTRGHAYHDALVRVGRAREGEWVMLYCNLPALGGDSTYSTISLSLHICAAPTSSRAHGTHATPATRPDWSLTHINQPTGQPAGPPGHPTHHRTVFTGFITIWACYHFGRGSGPQRKAPRGQPDGLPKLVVRPARSPEENSDGRKAIWGKYHV